jgi:hypothetical protein
MKGLEMDTSHPDHAALKKIRDAILMRTKGLEGLRQRFPTLIADAIDFVIDPVRTARTKVAELDNVEKTFVGLKIEHFFRDFLDLPKGIRDLRIEGYDLDIKNTVGVTWMIPPETYRQEEPCLLIASASKDNSCSLGLMMARDSYLTKPNRDKKRGVGKRGRDNILWIVERQPLPKSRWDGIDMARFRELRKIKGGAVRAAQFFRENIGLPVHRSVLHALLFDQKDYMKRIRGNGGARDLLKADGIAALSGTFDSARMIAQGFSQLGADYWVAVKYNFD